jgi:hypothetical protein
VFHDLALVHGLMPVLLELSDADGMTRAIAILPYPSLLPGGMHAAELRALQTEANPMDAFWSLSELLLREHLGQSASAHRSITSLAVDAEDRHAQPLSTPAVQDWLDAMFGIVISQPKSRKRPGLELRLPPESVPTITALVSRRLAEGLEGDIVGPFLVAERESFRPRWSVTLPANSKPHPNLPLLTTGRRTRRRDGVANAVSLHLAIALRTPEGPLDIEPTAGKNGAPTGLPPLSVLIDASDQAQTEALVLALRKAAGAQELQLLVRLSSPDCALSDLLDRLCIDIGWASVPRERDLREVARDARHETLLTISDRVNLRDGDILPSLCGLLREDSAFGSVSCVLLGETITKRGAVLQPATGGLFPAGVSFASSPRLTFCEPDVLQALSDLTYPVVANTLHLTAWRTNALADLLRPSGPVPPTAADIRLGLDLLASGYRNICTTKVRGIICAPYLRRDAIDPIGAAYVHPSRWEHVLNEVTVLRELF